MKKITFILFALIAGTGFAQNTDTGTATASAGIISTISIAQAQDLNFGGIISGTAGSVVIAPVGTVTETGVTLVTGTATSQAIFNVRAAEDVLFSVTVPSTGLTITATGGDTMIVNAFKHDALTTTAGSGSGTDVPVQVGATLTVGATQNDGLYSGTFDVTVDYN